MDVTSGLNFMNCIVVTVPILFLHRRAFQQKSTPEIRKLVPLPRGYSSVLDRISGSNSVLVEYDEEYDSDDGSDDTTNDSHDKDLGAFTDFLNHSKHETKISSRSMTVVPIV